LNVLADRLPGVPIFVCSDEPAFVAHLASCASQSLIYAPSLQLTGPRAGRDTIEGMRLALADLWGLASCEIVVASPSSSFARVACELSGRRPCGVNIGNTTIASTLTRLGWGVYRRCHY